MQKKKKKRFCRTTLWSHCVTVWFVSGGCWDFTASNLPGWCDSYSKRTTHAGRSSFCHRRNCWKWGVFVSSSWPAVTPSLPLKLHGLDVPLGLVQLLRARSEDQLITFWWNAQHPCLLFMSHCSCCPAGQTRPSKQAFGFDCRPGLKAQINYQSRRERSRVSISAGVKAQTSASLPRLSIPHISPWGRHRTCLWSEGAPTTTREEAAGRLTPPHIKATEPHLSKWVTVAAPRSAGGKMV